MDCLDWLISYTISGYRFNIHWSQVDFINMYLKKYNLKGKYSLVTGAGKGLGRACTIALAEAGSNLILISRTKKDLESVENIKKT